MSTSTAEPVITVSGLVRRFRRKTALEGADLDVRKGTVHGLIGENGAGKTTLIKHLLGVLKPHGGAVQVLGLEPTRNQVSVLANIGYLSEERDLPGWMRVLELLRYTQAFYPAWDEGYANALLDRFRLDPKARVKDLSRGERAKAGLVCALAYRPALLILDEPSTGLDVATRRDILWAMLRSVADEGRTVLFSSHLLDEVERCADSLTILHEGRTTLSGPLDDIKEQRPLVEVAFAHEPDTLPPLPSVQHAEKLGREWRLVLKGTTGPPFLQALADADGTLLSERPATLEELFLAETGAMPPSGA